MEKNILISVVSPVYRAEKIVPELVSQIAANVGKITPNFEIILVEDGSPDGSWNAVVAECKNDPRVIGIKLSRNFGQHHAITAGLESAKGEWVVVMDCDLQDRPDQIPILFEKAKEGNMVVVGRRSERKDHFFKRFSSWAFHKVLSYLTGTNFDNTVANFGIYNRKVIQAVLSMQESIRYFPTMVKWVGFSPTVIDIKHAERFEGKTSYNLGKLIGLAMNIMLAYSDKPLRLMLNFGLFMSFTAFLFGCYIVIRALTIGFDVLGYGSLIFSIWFIGGIIIFMLGLVGLYVGKTFEGVKRRPLFIVADTLNK